MIVGFIPGIVLSLTDSLSVKKVINSGREDFGSPFSKAAAAILLTNRFDILPLKIAESMSSTLVSALGNIRHEMRKE